MDSSILNKKIKAGFRKVDINKEIINEFDTFFINKANLERYSNDFLIHDWINYKKLNFDELKTSITKILEIFNLAKTIDAQKIFKDFAMFQKTTTEMGNKYWSLCILQRDFSLLEEFEYIMECFKMIEDISEITLKNYLALCLQIQRISNKKLSNLEDVMKLKYGNVVNELFTTGFLTEKLKPHNLSISQWRNISAHKSYSIIDKKIVCKYGNNLENTITFENKEEVLNVVKGIYDLSQIINFAFKFFHYDNIEEIARFFYSENIQDISEENRNETWHLLFVTEAYTSGFKVKEINESKDNLEIEVFELTEEDRELRAIQSSILLYKAWYYTSKEKIKIIYTDRNEKKYMSSEADDRVFKEIGNGNKEITYLAENVIFKKI